MGESDREVLGEGGAMFQSPMLRDRKAGGPLTLKDLLARFRWSTPSVDALLAELEPLTHTARVRRMVELGADPSWGSILLELAGRGVYERRLALYSVYGSRDATVLDTAAAHPSQSVANLANKLAPVCFDDESATARLRAVPKDRRNAFLRRLARGRRRGIVDAFLRELVNSRPDEALPLLQFASSALLSDLFRSHEERFDSILWTRLARHHPAVVVARWKDKVAVGSSMEQRDRRKLHAILVALAPDAPDPALSLIEEALQSGALLSTELPLAALVSRRPEAVAALVLRLPEPPNVNFGCVAHRLSIADRLALLGRSASLLSPQARWIGLTPPDERLAVASLCLEGLRDRDGVVAIDVIVTLPMELRHSEARRHLLLPKLATRIADRMAYARLLPWTAAKAATHKAREHPDAAHRGAALAALIGCTAFDRSQRQDALALVLARKKEQDPVRSVMLCALADLPAGSWVAADLPAIDALTRHALAAADISHATAAQLQRLLWSLVRTDHRPTALTLLVLVAESRGQLASPPPGVLQHEETAVALDLAFDPLLSSWLERREHGRALSILSVFGRFLYATKSARTAVVTIARETHETWTAVSALARVAHGGDPRWFDQTVMELLDADSSWGVRPEVLSHLSRWRQDRLSPFLGGHRHKGRFHDGGVRIIPQFTHSLSWRWTPALQAAWAKGLEELLSTPDPGKREMPTRLRGITDLATLSYFRSAVLMAAAADSDEAIRDASLRALGRLDDGGGVPVLIEALGDARARIAIYALRKGILAMPPQAAMSLLQAAPMGKVTVAKEVLRLVGDVSGPSALAWLLALDPQTLHRDARIARLRALWNFLDSPEVWDRFDQAASDPDGGLLDGVLRIPAARLGLESRSRFLRLFERLVGHEDPVVSLAALRRFLIEPLGRADGALSQRIAQLCTSPFPEIRQAAASALIEGADSLPGETFALAARLCLPNRAWILDFAGQLGSLPTKSMSRTLATRGRHPPTRSPVGFVFPRSHRGAVGLTRATRSVVQVLNGDRRTISLRVALAIRNLPCSESAVAIEQIAASGALHPETFVEALDLPSLRLELDGAPAIEALESSWRQHPDERMRRIALEALCVRAGGNRGWTLEARSILAVYRGDESVLVSESALDVIVPPIEPETH